jgi:hypothetical protein
MAMKNGTGDHPVAAQNRWTQEHNHLRPINVVVPAFRNGSFETTGRRVDANPIICYTVC